MAIDDADIARLKEIFVTREKCDDRSEAIDTRLSSGDTKFALIEQQLTVISWVSKTTLGAVIVAIVGALLSLIFKK